MEKSFVKLVLTQEVVEKLCEQNPEFRIELEQMALKWVKQSVIKPLVVSGVDNVVAKAKSHIQQLVNEVLHANIFANTVRSRYTLEENDKLVRATVDLLVRETQPDTKASSAFWEQVKDKREAALAGYDAQLKRYLKPEMVEKIVRDEVKKSMKDILDRLSKETAQ